MGAEPSLRSKKTIPHRKTLQSFFIETKRKQKELKSGFAELEKSRHILAETEEKWRAVAENSLAFLILINRAGKILFINRVFPKYSIKKVIGSSVFNYIPSKFWPLMKRKYEHVWKTGEPAQYEVDYIHDDGTVVAFDSRVGPVRDSSGKMKALTISAVDTTWRRNLEKKVLESERFAVIGKMASHVAHEVRNPLSSISLNMEILHEELEDVSKKLGAEENNKLDFLASAIQKEIERLENLVTYYLEFHRLPDTQKESVDLIRLVADFLAFHKQDAHFRNLRIVYRHSKKPLKFLADPDQIRQMLLNLLKNAAESMPSGGRIEIICEREKEDAMISIRDQGSGIEKKHLDKIYDPFYSSKKIGTGLGLAMVKQIVTNHKGWIECRSSKNKGTTFSIRLPLASGD